MNSRHWNGNGRCMSEMAYPIFKSMSINYHYRKCAANDKLLPDEGFHIQ